MKVFHHVPYDLGYTITSEDTDEGRFYTTPLGRRYPSITTILKAHSEPHIAKWRAAVGDEEADRVMRKSSARGTRFHTLSEQYLNNEVYTFANIIDAHMFRIAQPMLNDIDNIRIQEAGLYSDHLRLAGRVDCIAEYRGKLSIIDFKTARKLKEYDDIQHYFMQATAYAIMWEERTGQPISSLVIMMVSDEGENRVFTGKRNNFVAPLLQYRDLFEQHYART
jgi:ATP-dependent exoDNAse (exonuclease V) beta subunit